MGECGGGVKVMVGGGFVGMGGLMGLVGLGGSGNRMCGGVGKWVVRLVVFIKLRCLVS